MYIYSAWFDFVLLVVVVVVVSISFFRSFCCCSLCWTRHYNTCVDVYSHMWIISNQYIFIYISIWVAMHACVCVRRIVHYPIHINIIFLIIFVRVLSFVHRSVLFHFTSFICFLTSFDHILFSFFLSRTLLVLLLLFCSAVLRCSLCVCVIFIKNNSILFWNVGKFIWLFRRNVCHRCRWCWCCCLLRQWHRRRYRHRSHRCRHPSNLHLFKPLFILYR